MVKLGIVPVFLIQRPDPYESVWYVMVSAALLNHYDIWWGFIYEAFNKTFCQESYGLKICSYIGVEIIYLTLVLFEGRKGLKANT